MRGYKIVGVSNPNFVGVTVATKAICNDWIPVSAAMDEFAQHAIIEKIRALNPDLLIIGGWSPGYAGVLHRLKAQRTFPVLAVHHSTLFHGPDFHADWEDLEVERCFKRGHLDLIGYVQPQMAEYYLKVKRTFAAFVPHAFAPTVPKYMEPGLPFRVGILGGSGWYKNTCGASLVARDFAANFKNTELVTTIGYNKPREAHINIISNCGVLVHVSHLECYSNTVQEAWACGVPVIMSPACNGLTDKNPLLDATDKAFLKKMTLLSSTDAVELYDMLARTRKDREELSEGVYSIAQKLYDRTATYTQKLFKSIIENYPNREHDLSLLELPFSKRGIKWQKSAHL